MRRLRPKNEASWSSSNEVGHVLSKVDYVATVKSRQTKLFIVYMLRDNVNTKKNNKALLL